jgi:hypothetical protein
MSCVRMSLMLPGGKTTLPEVGPIGERLSREYPLELADLDFAEQPGAIGDEQRTTSSS